MRSAFWEAVYIRITSHCWKSLFIREETISNSYLKLPYVTCSIRWLRWYTNIILSRGCQNFGFSVFIGKIICAVNEYSKTIAAEVRSIVVVTFRVKKNRQSCRVSTAGDTIWLLWNLMSYFPAYKIFLTSIIVLKKYSLRIVVNVYPKIVKRATYSFRSVDPLK